MHQIGNNMAQWHGLGRLMQEARAARESTPPTERDVQAAIVDGLARLFDPVYEVFDKLREEGIFVQTAGHGSIPRLIPNGAELKAREIGRAHV